MTQNDALNILKLGKNVFLTGPAGSGKTYVLNQYIKYLKEHDVPIGITASTGIAATHIGGMTIHSWSGMGIKNSLNKSEIQELAQKGQAGKRIQNVKVLIIDEISMLHHFRLDMLDEICRDIRKNDEPFGGIQVILCGDFFQLPPVSRYGEPDANFAYHSNVWKKGVFTVCYLHENFRQSDNVMLTILNEIRSGQVGESAGMELNNRRVNSPGGEASQEIEIQISETVEYDRVPTRLFTHNIDVDAVNKKELSKVDAPEIIHEMTSKGRKSLVEVLKKTCLAPEFLRLKEGARVMCVKNNFEKGFVNGTLGVVVSCGYLKDPVIRTAPSPEYPRGRLLTIERATWEIEDQGKVLAMIEQYPLRLAWAITVHKSQGMSLDSVEVDLSKSFEPGMGYVALSRVRSIKGLTILGINSHALKVHPEVLEYDRSLKESSEKAERIMQAANEREITQCQNEFLAKVAPLHAIGKRKRDKKGKIVKPKKPSTFEITAALVKEGKSLGEMAGIRGITQESVVGQIERLIEGGKNTGEGLNLPDIAYLKKEIPVRRMEKLEKALEEVSMSQIARNETSVPFLGPVKSKVGFNASWKEIKLARVLLGYVKKILP